MGNHPNAITTIEAAISKLSKDPEEIKDFNSFLDQEKSYLNNMNGRYDYNSLFKHIGNPSVPAESYIGPIKVEYTEAHGRGLYAAKDIKKGELVSASKAYAFYKWNLELKDIPRSQRVNAAHEEMTRNIIDRIAGTPEEAQRINMLYDGKVAPKTVTIEMLNPHYQFAPTSEAVDPEKIRRIVKHNSYSVQYWCTNVCYVKQTNIKESNPFYTGKFGSGLWLLDSFYNHSCDPNVVSLYIGDVKFVRAIKDIKVGEELFIQYLDINESYNSRQRVLKGGYGFDCKCERCAVQGSISTEMKAKIKKAWRFTFKFGGADNVESKMNNSEELPFMFSVFDEMKGSNIPLRYGIDGKFKRSLLKCCIYLEQNMNYNGSIELYKRIMDWVDDIHLVYAAAEQMVLVHKQLLSLKNPVTQGRIEDLKKIHMMLYDDEKLFNEKYKAFIFPLAE